jgi:hypothetical protein
MSQSACERLFYLNNPKVSHFSYKTSKTPNLLLNQYILDSSMIDVLQ